MYVCPSKFHLKSKCEEFVLSDDITLLYSRRKFDLPIVTMEARMKWNRTDAENKVLSNEYYFLYV